MNNPFFTSKILYIVKNLKFTNMTKKVIVLGAGMVGRAIVYDLSGKYNVTVVDIDESALEYCKEHYNVLAIKEDLSDITSLAEIIDEADLVVSALPGFMGYNTLKTAIIKGKDIVDISFMPEDFTELDKLAKENNVTAIADCGVAPGMPNIILGHYDQKLQIEKFEYMVGGLPKERKFPFEYKAPFSPVDVLEEYTRPARVMENGTILSKPAMSEPELVYFENLGHLEAFNTDGLRSLLTTMEHIPNMKEKTLRYPGHIRLIQALQEAGFFDDKPIQIGENSIKPFDFTSTMLINEWKLEKNEEEFTLMKINIQGTNRNEPTDVTYELLDKYDAKTGLSSMARTTGFTATAAVNLITHDIYTNKGVFPPEQIGRDNESYEFIMDYLKDRNIQYKRKQPKKES
jgi:saccharopine dehydrogenase-like NADP-dependent oxidoreductase